MGFPTRLEIEELTGEKHTLTLSGRSMPYQPIAFEGAMRAEFTWYPGNPQATAQVLGPSESPTSINGVWKDRFIKTATDPIPELNIPELPVSNVQGRAEYDGILVRDVSSLVSAMDGFRRRGQMLKMTWDQITRHGLMTKFRHAWLRHEDVEWEVEFTWMSQGEDTVPIAFGQENNIEDLANAIADAVNALIAVVQAVFNLINEIASLINNLVDMIVEAVSAIVDLVQQAIELVMLPFQVAEKIKAAYETIADACTGIIDTIESVPDQVLNAASSLVGGTEPEALQAETYKRDVKVQARNVRVIAKEAQQQVAATAEQQPAINVVQPRQDQDLRSVSTQQYGSPNEWRRLRRYNRLRGSRLSAGSKLLIPRIQVPVQGSRRG